MASITHAGRVTRRSIRSFWMQWQGFAALLALLALGTLIFNLVGNARFPFWADEAYTVLAVRARSWSELLLLNLRNEETPPLYFALLRLWALFWGDSREATLRAFSALCLAAAVPVVGVLGARLWSRSVGVIAALLLAINPFSHYYGQETRAYALAILLAAVVLLIAHAYLIRPHVRIWALYILAAATLIYTIYTAAFALATLGIVVGALLLRDLIERRTRGAAWALAGWISAQLIVCVMLVPWLAGVQYQLLVSTGARSANTAQPVVQALLALLMLGSAQPDGSPISALLVIVVALALLAATARLCWLGMWRQRVFLFAAVGLPIGGVVLMFSGDGQFTARYILIALPAYIVLLAVGLAAPGRAQRITRAVLALLIIGSISYNATMQPSNQRRGGWNAMAALVAVQAQPGDALFFAPPWALPAFAVQYSGPALPLHGAQSFAEYYYEQQHPFVETTFESATLQQQLACGQRAWIVRDHVYGVRPVLPADVTIDEHVFGSTSLVLVTPQSDPARCTATP